MPGHAAAYRRLEVLQHAGGYEKHHALEAGAHGVVNRIVDDEFAVRAHGLYLFGAAVAGAQPRGEYDERRF